MKHGRRALKNLVFGDTLLPQEFTVGMVEPQAEIGVWLHGMGIALDVTHRHSTACSDPFTICIAFEEGQRPNDKDLRHLSLKFCERDGQKRVLGEIGLKLTTTISMGGSELLLFEARSSANYCLPSMLLCAHYLLHAYSQWRRVDNSDIKMSFLERRAAMVTFIRPHPVSLVSLVDEYGGNIFPMNIMGDLGNGRFGFALKDSRRAAHLVEHAGRIAVSSVPLSQAPLVFQLAANHFKQSIVWNQLPFATKPSTAFNIPVPVFTQRVREMEIEKVQRIGSHTFFVARIVRDESFAQTAGLCVIHGFYQAWRLRGRYAELRASLAEDLFNKRAFDQ
jgi:flavin reductase (DIM6/NTAB) family NADH-FMN oxidoreductase RutF